MTARRLVICDLDETLVVTTHHFHNATQGFVREMVEMGFTGHQAIAALRHEEARTLSLAGYTEHFLKRAMGAAYRSLCREAGRMPLAIEERIATEHGNGVYWRPSQPIDGAREAIEQLFASGYRLAILTKGPEGPQNHKLAVMELRNFFERVFCFPHKGVQEFRQVLKEMRSAPENAVMIGNSIASDINPATAAGLQAIHVPYDGLEIPFELAPIAQPEAVQTVSSIAEVPDAVARAFAAELEVV